MQVKEKNEVKHEQVQRDLSRGSSLQGWAR